MLGKEPFPRTLDEKVIQYPSQYAHTGIGEQRVGGCTWASANTTLLNLSLTSIGGEEVTWAGNPVV